MKIIDFVEGYNKTTTNLKDRYLKEKLEIRNYISFADKCDLAERVIKATTFEKDLNGENTGNIKINSISRYLLFTLSIIDIYTNLEVDFNNVISEYDLLKSNGLLDLFIGAEYSLIPNEEFCEAQTLLNIYLDDILQNNMSTQAFIQNQVTRFGTLIGVTLSPIMDKLADNINSLDEKTVEKMGKQLDKMFSKIK